MNNFEYEEEGSKATGKSQILIDGGGLITTSA